MRINFNSSFKQVSRLIEDPARGQAPVESRPAFTELLGQAGPNASQPPGSTSQIGQQPAPPSPLVEEPRARFAMHPPDLLTPPLETIDLQEPVQPSAPEPDAGVKTPTLVSATRVPHQSGGVSLKGDTNKIAGMLEQASKQYGIDPALGMAVMQAESSFNSKAVSSDGHASKGLFQLLDSTGRELHEQGGHDGDYNPFDPKLNISLGVSYLRRLHDLFSSETTLPNQLHTVAAANSTSLEKLAVAAFNAGEGRVASAQERAKGAGKDPSEYASVAPYLPESTREYVERVTTYKSRYEGQFVG